MNESVRIEAVAIAAFTLTTQLLDQMAKHGLIPQEVKQAVLRSSVEAARRQGGDVNIDAAAILSMLK